MSYLVLARKYRPQTFNEVYAQDHITKTLMNAIEMDRIAHAYLFTGPRGVGKTSMARIFAKSLNCINGPTSIPCNVCQNCLEITASTSTDVIEIDGASNTGVDDIRELQKELLYSASNSKYKIYIIDEVHMLSKNAFNALLKTLEEPPPNVIFIFATTEPHKILPTIISRCQRFDCKRIPINSIIARLKDIAVKDSITIDDEALFIIAKKADGGMRDALSLLDQVLSCGSNSITTEDVLSIFGIVNSDIYAEIMSAIVNHDAAKIIGLLHVILEKGNDLQEFFNGLLDHIRNILLLKIGISVAEIPKSLLNSFVEFAKKIEENDLLYLMSYIIKAKTDIKNSNNPVLIAEMSFIKLAKISEIKSVEKILEQLANGKLQTGMIATPQANYTPQSQVNSQTNNNEQLKQKIETVPKIQPKIESLSVELLKNNWSLLLKKIGKEKPIVVNFLKNCKIDAITNNKIHFSTNSSLGFNKLKDNKDLLSEIISKHFSLKIPIVFVKTEIKKDESYIRNPTLQDIQEKSPKLAAFIEATDSIISR